MDFKTILCGTVSLALLAGCSTNTSSSLFKSGTYEASSAGRNGDVKLTVTFSSSKIEKIINTILELI